MLCFCLLFLYSPLFEQPRKPQAGTVECVHLGSKYICCVLCRCCQARHLRLNNIKKSNFFLTGMINWQITIHQVCYSMQFKGEP